MFGRKKENMDDAYIIRNIRGVPVYDLKNYKYLLDFNDRQKAELGELLNSNLDNARSIFKEIAFKGLPAEFMSAYKKKRYYSQKLMDGNIYCGYNPTNPIYAKELDKFIHCNLSLEQFKFCAEFYQLFRYIDDVPRYDLTTLRLLSSLWAEYPQDFNKLHNGMTMDEVRKLCKKRGIEMVEGGMLIQPFSLR